MKTKSEKRKTITGEILVAWTKYMSMDKT